VAGCQVVDPTPQMGDRVTQAILRQQPPPVLSPEFGEGLTEERAYRVQRLAVEQLHQGRAPAGFKAGLTTAASQRAYATDRPLAGVLPPGAELQPIPDDGYRVQLADYRKPLFEAEIGYRFNRRIDAPLADVQALRAAVAEVVPVIEIADLGFAAGADGKPAAPTVLDIVATNAGARRVIAGHGRAPEFNDPNAVAVAVYRDGELQTKGRGSDALGDQWQALLWLVNRSVANGWIIFPGHLLITGTLGAQLAPAAGLYVADFGEFGRLEWWVE
jgi:2-keto-4-pentenoate hydratase